MSLWGHGSKRNNNNTNHGKEWNFFYQLRDLPDSNWLCMVGGRVALKYVSSHVYKVS